MSQKIVKRENLPSGGYYQITNYVEEEEASLYIYGDIGGWFGDESVSASQIVEELKGITAKKITVYINSFGGLVSDGIAIYNQLKAHPAEVHTVIDGVGMSIASLIAMAADPGKITMHDVSMLMIHGPLAFIHGNAVELRKHADILDKFADVMANTYARDGGLSKDAVLALLMDGEDHYFTAQEALALGLVDVVKQSPNSVKLAASAMASYASSRFFKPAADGRVSKPEANTMANEENTLAGQGANGGAGNEINAEAIQNEARATERASIAARNAELAPIYARFMDRDGVSDMYNAALANPDVTVDQARAQLLDHLGKDAAPVAGTPHINAEAGADQRDKRRSGMQVSLLARLGRKPENASDMQGNPWAGMRLSELARACLVDAGVKVAGMSQIDIAEVAMGRPMFAAGGQTRSDFPVLLEDTLHKMILEGFRLVPITYDRFCKIGDVSDFREWNRLVPGVIGNLEAVNELGEYRDKPLPDAVKNAISASRRGNIIAISPETIVNDDTGYIQSMTMTLGGAGARTIERTVYTLLESNPALSDGVELFHADHGNLAASGAAPSVTTLDAAGLAMASQTAPGADAEPLDINPEVALVHRGLRGTFFEVVNAEFNDEATKNQRRPNSVRGIVSDIVASVRLSSTTAWYLFADPMIAPVIEVVFLDGQREPRIVQEEDFRTGGLRWRVELAHGVGAIDYRGAYKNAGA